MSYSLFHLQEPFASSKVQVTDYHLGTNKLWVSEDGTHLLHHVIQGHGFLKEIGLFEGYNDIPNWTFSDESLITLFRHFYANDSLYHVQFYTNPSDDFITEELSFFANRYFQSTERDTQTIRDATEYFRYLVEEVIGKPHFFRLKMDKTAFRLYTNSTVHESLNGSNEDTILTFYQTLLELSGKPITWKEVLIEEKDKVPHPLQKSHDVLEMLFELAGQEAKERLQLDDATFETIRRGSLDEMKPYERKMIYS